MSGRRASTRRSTQATTSRRDDTLDWILPEWGTDASQAAKFAEYARTPARMAAAKEEEESIKSAWKQWYTCYHGPAPRVSWTVPVSLKGLPSPVPHLAENGSVHFVGLSLLGIAILWRQDILFGYTHGYVEDDRVESASVLAMLRAFDRELRDIPFNRFGLLEGSLMRHFEGVGMHIKTERLDELALPERFCVRGCWLEAAWDYLWAKSSSASVTSELAKELQRDFRVLSEWDLACIAPGQSVPPVPASNYKGIRFEREVEWAVSAMRQALDASLATEWEAMTPGQRDPAISIRGKTSKRIKQAAAAASGGRKRKRDDVDQGDSRA